ncbi:MAG: hypothetical protein V1798_06065 [Pseudomonadota bacterium]
MIERARYVPQRGVVLLIVALILIVAALAGVVSLSTTRVGFLRAGHFRGSTKLMYDAEDGLKKAAVRLQEISLGRDPIGTFRDLNLLLTTLPAENAVVPALASYPPECSDAFSPTDPPPDQPVLIAGSPTNVICNFMGKALSGSDTQVILVRKPDQIQGSLMAAVFLLNAISRDAVGRKKIVQGVVVIPYAGGSDGVPFLLPPGSSAALVTTLKTSAD